MQKQNRISLARAGASAAMIGGLVLGVAAAPAQAQSTRGSTGGNTETTACVLSNGGGVTCGKNARKVGAAALTIYQSPNYKGKAWTLYLPHEKKRCTAKYEKEFLKDLTHGSFWDNRVSSVKTYNKCDVKFHDGHHLKAGKKGSTVWIDKHNRLSNLKFDNVASSFSVT